MNQIDPNKPYTYEVYKQSHQRLMEEGLDFVGELMTEEQWDRLQKVLDKAKEIKDMDERWEYIQKHAS